VNKYLKWFLIIVGVLVVLGFLVLIPGLFMLGHRGFGMMRPFGGMPMMRSFGFFHLGGFFLRLLIPAFVIGLLVILGVAIGKSSHQAMKTAQVAQIVPADVTAEVTPLVCSNCGKEIQAGWKHCPHCGANL
jgi:hypothetical protein